jgi:hypothetical protein
MDETWFKLRCVFFMYILSCFNLMIFFMKFFHFAKIILKKYHVINSLIFAKKFGRKPILFMKNSPKITKTTYNMKGCFKFVYFHSLNIAQFVVDDCQLRIIRTSITFLSILIAKFNYILRGHNTSFLYKNKLEAFSKCPISLSSKWYSNFRLFKFHI